MGWSASKRAPAASGHIILKVDLYVAFIVPSKSIRQLRLTDTA